MGHFPLSGFELSGLKASCNGLHVHLAAFTIETVLLQLRSLVVIEAIGMTIRMFTTIFAAMSIGMTIGVAVGVSMILVALVVEFHIAIFVFNHDPKDVKGVLGLVALEGARPDRPDARAITHADLNTPRGWCLPKKLGSYEILTGMVPLHYLNIGQQGNTSLFAGGTKSCKTSPEELLVSLAEIVEILCMDGLNRWEPEIVHARLDR